jgi:hypothetical protein
MPAQTKAFVGKSFETCLAAVRGTGTINTLYGSAPQPTPEELHAIYGRGFQGIVQDSVPFETKSAYKEMRGAMPKLYEIFPWAKGLGKGKISAPYLACVMLIAGWGGLYAQVQGDCTVHGTEHAAETDYCNDVMWGEAKFMGPIAFENIYRSRGFNGDGWSCEAPCMYVGPEGKGGFLYRTKYDGPSGESVDLTDYNSSWQSNGRAGVPEWLAEISRKNKAKWIIPIENMEEYRDALALGFGINFCSGQAWTSDTDEYGVATARGSWSHAMAHVGCNDTDWARQKYGDLIGLIQNSWGKWNRINGKPDGAPELSPGSFYSRASSISRLLDGDQYAVCSVWGWERTGWEVFDAGELRKQLRSSTSQVYYKHRSEKMAELTEKAIDQSHLFLAG